MFSPRLCLTIQLLTKTWPASLESAWPLQGWVLQYNFLAKSSRLLWISLPSPMLGLAMQLLTKIWPASSESAWPLQGCVLQRNFSLKSGQLPLNQLGRSKATFCNATCHKKACQFVLNELGHAKARSYKAILQQNVASFL